MLKWKTADPKASRFWSPRVLMASGWTLALARGDAQTCQTKSQ
jgi:hypothetical protein